ncbi:MAG: TetR/AcrR family transcriptional regulator, partial [Microcystis sp.]
TLIEKLKILGQFMTNREDSCIKQLFLWIDYSQYQGREELRRSQLFERVDRRYHQAVIKILGISDPSVAWLVVSVINGLILERLWCNAQIATNEQL